MREKRSQAKPNQTIPSNWTRDGVSEGKKTGAVRPSPNAYQGSRKGSKS